MIEIQQIYNQSRKYSYALLISIQQALQHTRQGYDIHAYYIPCYARGDIIIKKSRPAEYFHISSIPGQYSKNYILFKNLGHIFWGVFFLLIEFLRLKSRIYSQSRLTPIYIIIQNPSKLLFFIPHRNLPKSNKTYNLQANIFQPNHSGILRSHQTIFYCTPCIIQAIIPLRSYLIFFLHRAP